MKDLIISIGISVTATVAAYFIVREIENDFWRTKHYYGRANRAFKKSFKKQAA